MDKQVIFRDRQEMTSDDFNNSQSWGHEAHAHLIKDAISPERQFVGLTVTNRSATELETSPGRLYDGATGNVYSLATAQVESVFAHAPVADSRWLAVSAYGVEEETDMQTRDRVIDLQTGQSQPESVAMQLRRKITLHIAVGLESPTPEKPEPPTGYTLLAHARMTPSGIQEVILAESRRLPNLHALTTRVTAAEGWILSAKARISSIVSDIAGLGEAVNARATIEQAIQLAMDMARVKERLEISDDYVFYGADHFLTDDESDETAVGYSARTSEGLRPAIVAQETTALALLNPLDPEAKVSSDGLLLPAYNEVTRLRMENRVGELTISAYQYQTTNLTLKSMSRTRIQYGETRSYCTNSAFWKSGKYDPSSGILRLASGETWLVAEADRRLALINHKFVRVTQFWESTYSEPYWDAVTTTHTLNGSVLGQTVLMHQTGYLTSVELYITHKDASAGMTVLLTDASRGQPDLTNCLSRQELAANALSEGWCKITLPRPVYVEAGRRYALILATGAQHRVGYTEGVEYTQGVLLYAQDGSFFSEAVEKDLMLRLNFAQFTTPRAVIQFNALQLTGGIADLDLLFENITPDGTELHFEYQIAGIWYPVAAGSADNLATQPGLLPLRGVFVGTTDLMPAVRMTGSQVIVSRAGTSFTHFSTTRTIGAASDDIEVRLLLEDFDPGTHTIDVDLVIGGSPVNATSYKDEIVDGRSRWRIYTFSLGSTTTSYVIKIMGSTSNWRVPFHVAERYDLAF